MLNRPPRFHPNHCEHPGGISVTLEADRGPRYRISKEDLTNASRFFKHLFETEHLGADNASEIVIPITGVSNTAVHYFADVLGHCISASGHEWNTPPTLMYIDWLLCKDQGPRRPFWHSRLSSFNCRWDWPAVLSAAHDILTIADRFDLWISLEPLLQHVCIRRMLADNPIVGYTLFRLYARVKWPDRLISPSDWSFPFHLLYWRDRSAHHCIRKAGVSRSVCHSPPPCPRWCLELLEVKDEQALKEVNEWLAEECEGWWCRLWQRLI